MGILKRQLRATGRIRLAVKQDSAPLIKANTPARQHDVLDELIGRARRIFQYEQRNGHADNAVKPGGLESFVVHWTQDVRNARATHQANPTSAPAHTRANSDTIGAQGRPPEDAIERLLTGYHALDPMQRTAKLRAALALLDAFDSRDTQEHPSSASMRPLRQPHDSHTDEAEIRRSSATALA